MSTLVFLGLPHNGEMSVGAFRGLAGASQSGIPFVFEDAASSLLQRNFNELLAKCRMHDPRPSHFALHHADIAANVGWLDIMLDEMRSLDADVISAVSPIKDHRGLTTTGRFSEDFTKLKRFTMSEIMAMPETFGAEEAGGPLAVNTGLMLIRTDRPWFDRLVFQMQDGIHADDDGKLAVWCRSEDWLASEWLHQQGARVFATRKVRLAHMGTRPFYNFVEHGTEKSEEERNWRT